MVSLDLQTYNYVFLIEFFLNCTRLVMLAKTDYLERSKKPPVGIEPGTSCVLL